MHSPSIPIPREQGNGWSGEKEKRDLGYGSHLGGSHPKQRPNRLDYIYTITINYNQKKKYIHITWSSGIMGILKPFWYSTLLVPKPEMAMTDA